MIVAATCILLGVPENLLAATVVLSPNDGNGDALQTYGGGGSASIEGMELIGDMYEKLIDICHLPAVHALLLYLATMQVSMQSAE